MTCLAPSSVVASTEAQQRLRDAARHHDEGEHDRDRQQQVENAAREIDPEVADRLGFGAREGADQREGHGEARGGGHEIVHRQPGHLRQMAHRGLAAVVLPVGVGDEADGRVEGEVRGHAVEPLRVQRQIALQALQRVKAEEAGGAEGQHGERVAAPALLALRIDAGQGVKAALHGREDRAS